MSVSDVLSFFTAEPRRLQRTRLHMHARRGGHWCKFSVALLCDMQHAKLTYTYSKGSNLIVVLHVRPNLAGCVSRTNWWGHRRKNFSSCTERRWVNTAHNYTFSQNTVKMSSKMWGQVENKLKRIHSCHLCNIWSAQLLDCHPKHFYCCCWTKYSLSSVYFAEN